MTQSTTTNGIVTLSSAEGMILNNGNTYSTKVWLGVNDSPDNWTEVPYSEYEEWQRQMAEEMGDDYQPQPDPEPEPVDLTELEAAKRAKIREIEEYDYSAERNTFYLDDIPVLLRREDRAGLRNRLDAEEAEGKENTTLWQGTNSFTLPVALAKYLLNKAEIYAAEIYDITHQHLANVNALETVAEVEAYDYLGDYPDNLRLSMYNN